MSTTTKFTPPERLLPEGYEVTADGKVFSKATNWRGHGAREMRQQEDASGYPSVRLTKDGVRKRIAVHRLVAEQYLPDRPSLAHEIRHLNGDRKDPSATNLAWGTRKDNADDRARHGRTSCGKAHSDALRKGMAASKNPYYRHARGTDEGVSA